MRIISGIFIVACLLTTSCSPGKTPLVIYELARQDYHETITATGTIQSVNNLSIMGPQDYYGLMTVDWALPEGSRVDAGDTICQLKSDDFTRMLDDQVRNLETLKADLRRLEADNALNMAVLEAQLKENQAGMAINRLDSVQMQFAPPVRKKLMELELAKARVLERKLERKFLAEKTIDETEIRQMTSRIAQVENRIKTLEESVRGLTIVAPTAGILTASQLLGRIVMITGNGVETELGGYPKPGAQIYPELPLMSLPDLSEMEIQFNVQEVDFKRIEKGQPVAIQVDAANKLQTTGTVKSKSLAPKTHYAGSVRYKYYEVVVGIDSCHTLMTPGTSARCTITINHIRDTVVVPTMAIFERDSQKIIYESVGEKFRPVPVEIGLGNSSETIITKGLTGAETIALVEPPHNFILKPKRVIHE